MTRSVEAALDAFVFIRHGQTDAHVDGRICGGEWDPPLNKRGFEEAKRAAHVLEAAVTRVGLIVSSPMVRAVQTAEVFASRLGLPLQVLEGLREWKLGSWERQPSSWVAELFSGRVDPPGGEPAAEFSRRVTQVMGEVGVLSQGRTPLIVSHGAFGIFLSRQLEQEGVAFRRCRPVQFARVGDGWTTCDVV